MSKKITISTPKATPKNIPGGIQKAEIRGDVPRMRNPPQPPKK